MHAEWIKHKNTSATAPES